MDILEKDYQNVYKPLIKFLYNNPQFKFSIACNGIQISYFKKRRNELITILKNMVDSKQVELIGGGYYNPVLPLIFPIDRNSQIDMLSAEIRQIIGKRPRGIGLYADCWDSSLVNNLENSGIEYALLNSNCISDDKLKFLPIVMSDLGKSVTILPCYDNFIPEKDQSPKDFVASIIKAVQKIEKKDKYCQLSPKRIVNINLSHKQAQELLSAKWFDSFAKFLKENPDTPIVTTIPSNYNKEVSVKIPGYISHILNKKIIEEDDLTIFEQKGINKKDLSAFDYIYYYNQSNSLYNRIMYISMLVNQYKNDKMRKKAAREKLWQGQNGVGLLNNDSAFPAMIDRQKCFNYLMEAENILREDSKYKETLSNFDYDGDGLNEYVCRMEHYFATISLISGAIHDLQPVKYSGNYGGSLTRILNWDGKADTYKRGLFVDFLFSLDQYDEYIQGNVPSDGVFSQIHYEELKFAPNRHEIHLCASAIFLPTKQEVSLKKKYIINSEGMNVQYILKNNSNKTLKAKFAVESNFNNVNYINSKSLDYTVEVLNKDEKVDIDSSSSTVKLNKKNKLNSVDFVRINDVDNQVSFAFEPNELCSYFYAPIIFKRPAANNTVKDYAKTYISSLIWDVNIDPGKEIEKNINFTISSSGKKNKEKQKK